MYSWLIPQELSAFQTELCVMESKPLREVDRCYPHFDTPLMAFLFNHSVRRKVVRCLVWASESGLIFSLFLIKSWIQSSVQNRREQFVQRRQWAYRAVVPTFSTSPFLCNTFIFTFFQASGVISFCLMISLKICLTISFVSSSQALMSSARIPSLSGDLPFLSFLIASCNSSLVISGILVISSVSLMCTSVLLSFPYSSCSLSSYNYL